MGNNKKGNPLKLSLVLGSGTLIVTILVFIASELFLRSVAFLLGVMLLIIIIFIGIIFDIIGIAAAAGQEPGLNAKAAKKLPGAKEAVYMVQNSPRVSSFCSDVIGDICGTISGAIATALIFKIITTSPQLNQLLLSSITIGIVAAITVGGKSFGKVYAISRSNDIIFMVGKIINKMGLFRFIGRGR